ncbi:hypothetical protein [Streptomyces sp. NPDC004296]|uniref:hypothetical protein n=1 Tax=Streptomyces sp. NPDC004296 TaxID=3364697 RepID=UPI00368A727B
MNMHVRRGISVTAGVICLTGAVLISTPAQAQPHVPRTAAASGWKQQWYDSHTPTKHWSTANVSLGPGGSAVAADVRCTGGGTFKVDIRKAGLGISVGHTRPVPCSGTYRVTKSHLSRRWAFYFHIDVTARRPLQVWAFSK